MLINRYSFLTKLTLVVLLQGCGSGESGGEPIANFPPFAAVSQSRLQVQPGEEFTLSATVRDAEGETTQGRWEDSTGNIVSEELSVTLSVPEPGWYTYLFRAQDESGAWSNTTGVAVQAGNAQPAGGFALQLNGGGRSDDGRVKILLDDPATTERGPAIDVGADAFTIEFRIKGAAADNLKKSRACEGNAWIHGNIILDRDRYGQGRTYGVSVLGGKIAFGVSNEKNRQHTICGDTVITDGQWHHVAVTRDPATGYMTIFVNGQLDAEGRGPRGDISYPDDGVPADYCKGPCFFSDPFLVIGAEKHDAGPEWLGFTGLIDELRFSNGIRYRDSFQPPITALPVDADTIALFRFNEGSGVLVFDEVNDEAGILHLGGEPPGPAWVPVTTF